MDRFRTGFKRALVTAALAAVAIVTVGDGAELPGGNPVSANGGEIVKTLAGKPICNCGGGRRG
jgi:hypothetical protein